MRFRPALSELATVAVIVALCAALLLAWRYLLAAGFLAGAWRHYTRPPGLRRPSHFARNVQALSLAFASWQTRRLGRS